MPKRVPVAAARRVAQEQGLRQVIVIGWDGELCHCVTYGQTKADCAQAARGGEFWLRAMAAQGKPEWAE